MRFIVDECTGPGVARWLREQNHEVFSVYEDGRGMDDDTIVRKAFSENRILITKIKKSVLSDFILSSLPCTPIRQLYLILMNVLHTAPDCLTPARDSSSLLENSDMLIPSSRTTQQQKSCGPSDIIMHSDNELRYKGCP